MRILGLEALWNNSVHLEYVDRWVRRGIWSLPDPCAPATGTCSGGTQAGKYLLFVY